MLKVMIAEDDVFMAKALETFLAHNGYEVCGTAATVADGIELGDRFKPELAILDIRLIAGLHSRDIVAGLKRQGEMGVLYVTGNAGKLGAWGLTKSDGHAFLSKPFRPADLLRALEIVAQIVSRETVAPPFPDGFHIIDAVL